ncbi:MAG: hypothetical protein H7842_03205 [Gammaproteobacteria bacterium SHHR-1]|uniref:hypothetical protein n=1 Tax=Magnetovirga frankeli TaxID=947516 RepID=UPI001293754E|nr:hypothetical protein D5125_08605 [gamma proteobacterium SS-5]
MMQVSSVLFWGMAEALLLFFVLLLGLLGILYYRHARDQKAGRALVAQIKQSAAQRSTEIERLLSETYGYQGEQLEQHSKRIRKAEMSLYRNLLTLYLNRDAAKLPSLPELLQQALAPYQDLAPSGSAASNEPKADAADIEILRQENKELSDEMRITMDTLGRVLSEYASVFSEDDIDSSEHLEPSAATKAAPPSDSDADPEAATEEAEEVSDTELEDLFDEHEKPVTEQVKAAAEPEPEIDLDQDDLDALLDQAKDEMQATPEEPPTSQSDAEEEDFDLDSLFDEAASQVEAAEPEPEPEPEVDLTQDDLDALFDQASTESQAPAKADQPEAAQTNLDQDDLDALLEQSASEASVHTDEDSINLDDDGFGQDDLNGLIDEALLEAGLEPDEINNKAKQRTED